MEHNRYFEEALAGFTADVAYAGAVRHLHDLGLSVEEIHKKLLYPVSREKIEKVIADYEAKKNSPEADTCYVQETDKYGKVSFKKVKKTTP